MISKAIGKAGGWHTGNVIPFFFAYTLISSLNAGLEFPTQAIEQSAKAGDTQMLAAFPFKNTGTTTEKIIRLESSCGCTVPELAKREYAPGESGEIKAVFKFEGRTGWQSKDIRVVTESAPHNPIRLTMKTTIPEIFSVVPRMLVFRLDTPDHNTRTAAIKLDKELALTELTAKPKDDKIQATVTQDPATGEWSLIVNRPENDAPKRSSVLLTARFANDETRTSTVWIITQ